MSGIKEYLNVYSNEKKELLILLKPTKWQERTVRSKEQIFSVPFAWLAESQPFTVGKPKDYPSTGSESNDNINDRYALSLN